jgi:hypothetical protein
LGEIKGFNKCKMARVFEGTEKVPFENIGDKILG